MPSTHIYEYPSIPLKFSKLAGVTDHAQAWVGAVNTASLNLTADQVGSIVFTFVHLMIFFIQSYLGVKLCLHQGRNTYLFIM